MTLWDINPYVRFARSQANRIPEREVVALDHRAFYCVSGECTVRVAENEYTLKKGSFIMWRAGLPYQSKGMCNNCELLGCNFDFIRSIAKPHLPISYVIPEKFSEDLLLEHESCGIPECIFLKYVPFEEKFTEIIKEYTEKKIYSEERCSVLLKDIIVSAVRADRSNENSNQHKQADAVLEYVREHYNESLSNLTVAKYFSYHPNYISSLVKKRTGMPLHKYLLQYRIQMALIYLHSEKYNVTETAALTGFSDMKHFSKAFKQITGTTPVECLKNI